MITVERQVEFSRARRGRKQIHGGRERSKQMQKGADAPAISTGRVPRVSRLMVLRFRDGFQRLFSEISHNILTCPYIIDFYNILRSDLPQD